MTSPRGGLGGYSARPGARRPGRAAAVLVPDRRGGHRRVFAPTVQHAAARTSGWAAVPVAFGFAVLLLVSVLVHELAHAAAAWAVGQPRRPVVVLDLWGGHTAFAQETAGAWRSTHGGRRRAAVQRRARGDRRAGPPPGPAGVPRLLLLGAPPWPTPSWPCSTPCRGCRWTAAGCSRRVVWSVSPATATPARLAAGWCGRGWSPAAWSRGRCCCRSSPGSPAGTSASPGSCGCSWSRSCCGRARPRRSAPPGRRRLAPGVSARGAAPSGAWRCPPRPPSPRRGPARQRAGGGRRRRPRTSTARPAAVVDDRAAASVPEQRLGEVRAVRRRAARWPAGAVIDLELVGERLIETMQSAPHVRVTSSWTPPARSTGILAWERRRGGGRASGLRATGRRPAPELPRLAGRDAPPARAAPTRPGHRPAAALRRGPVPGRGPGPADRPQGPAAHHHARSPGKEFHTHRGRFAPRRADRRARGHRGHATPPASEYLALRPLLADYVLSMPRGAAVVYPKDAGQIVAMADIFPGRARGRGRASAPGALTHVPAACRRRRRACCTPSSAARTSPRSPGRNVETFFGGPHPAWTADRRRPRRALPSRRDRASTGSSSTCSPPGSASTPSAGALAPGGVLICYVATATQLSRVAEATARRRPVHRAARRGSRWCAAGTSRAWRSGPSTGWSGTPASWSPPGGWPTGSTAAAAPAPPGRRARRRRGEDATGLGRVDAGGPGRAPGLGQEDPPGAP